MYYIQILDIIPEFKIYDQGDPRKKCLKNSKIFLDRKQLELLKLRRKKVVEL